LLLGRARFRRLAYRFGFAFALTALIAVALSFLIPAVAALIPAFTASGTTETGFAPADRQFVGRIFAALRFTLAEAVLSSVLAVVIGLPAAFFVARRQFPGRRLLLALSGVPLCVPPMIIGLAFVLFYGRQGYLNTALMAAFRIKSPPINFLYSFAGIVIAHGFYNFPVVLRTVAQTWERLGESEEDAATLLGASPARLFLTVTLPRLSGSILSAAVLVFLYCFFSFIIVMLFGGIGGTSLEVELYRAARSAFDYRLAGWIALVETAAALGIVVLYRLVQRRLAADTAGLRPRRTRLRPAGGVERFALVAYLAGITLFFVGPLLAIALRSFVVTPGGFQAARGGLGFDVWRRLVERPNFLPALWNTVSVALPVSLVSTAAAACFALAEDRRRFAGRRRVSGRCRIRRVGLWGGKAASALRSAIFRVAPLAPLAVSSVVLGFGWTILSPSGDRLTLILAQSALAWPFAWSQIRSALDRIPAETGDSAALLSASPLESDFRVRLPLAWRGLVSGAAFTFAISAGDASLPLVLSLGRFENLSLLLFRLAGSYRFSEACACAVVLAALCGVVFFVGDNEVRS